MLPTDFEELDEFLWRTASEVLRKQEPGLIERRTLERVFDSKLALTKKIFAADKGQLQARISEQLLALGSNAKEFTLAGRCSYRAGRPKASDCAVR